MTMRAARIRVRFTIEWENFKPGDEVNFPPELADRVIASRVATEVRPIGPTEQKVIQPEEIKFPSEPTAPPVTINPGVEVSSPRRRRK